MLINHPPKSGKLEVEPTYGISLTTTFNIEAINWIDDDLPLMY